MMSKTSNIIVRIEPDVKNDAEKILNALGISSSAAITMFYKQIILNKGLPFDVKIPSSIDISKLTDEEINQKLEKGYKDVIDNNVEDSKVVFDNIRKDI